MITRNVAITLLFSSSCFADVVHWDGQTSDDWHTGSNWSFQCPNPPFCGEFVPGPDDEAVLTDTTFGTTVELSADVDVLGLTIGNGMDVNTNGFTMLAGGAGPGGVVLPVLIDGNGSQLILPDSPGGPSPGLAFSTFRFHVANGGRIAMNGGELSAAFSGSTVDSTSSINGNGELRFFNSDGTALVNDGTIQPVFGDLYLHAFADDASFDLDGASGDGLLDVDDGTFLATNLTLHVLGSLSDPFDGTLLVGEADAAHFYRPWQLGSTSGGSGLVEMNGRNGLARLSGQDITVRGSSTLIDIQSGHALFNAHLNVSNATLRAQTGTTVHFADGAVFAADATFETRDGYELFVQGELTEINQTTFDWDGPTGTDHVTWVYSGGHLRINSDHIDFFNAAFNGTVQVDGSTLEVNTTGAWRMNGRMDLNGISAPALVLGQQVLIGNDIDTGAADATVNVEGFLPQIHADVLFNSDSKVNFGFLALLGLHGQTTIEPGAEFQGDGAIVNQGTLDLRHMATVGVDLDNRGLVTFHPAVSGHAEVDEFRQQSSGQLSVELRIASLGLHDRLDVIGEAQLDGELIAINTGATMPTFGDSYTILTANSVTGEFSDVSNFPTTVPGSIWRVIYEPTMVTLSVTASADLNSDGSYNCADVDSLVAEIAAGTHAVTFDLTGDGSVDEADLTQWLTDAGAENLLSGNSYLVGDANLDGTVNGQDFVIWNMHKFTSDASWCSGDFNADGLIDGRDFLAWNANKFLSADGGSSAVPEPAVACGWLAVLVFHLRIESSNLYRALAT